jgi:hypothetical protein
MISAMPMENHIDGLTVKIAFASLLVRAQLQTTHKVLTTHDLRMAQAKLDHTEIYMRPTS